jgi:hypothetical protein
VYISRSLHIAARKMLLDRGLNFSEFVEELVEKEVLSQREAN